MAHYTYGSVYTVDAQLITGVDMYNVIVTTPD